MRLAWFSPLPPVRSGISAYSAGIVPRLRREHLIDLFVDRRTTAPADTTGTAPDVFDAHDFVWKHQRQPYDLVVYQLGNAPCHDYMWAYLARYPGLVVLHDARLHQARARQLLMAGRADDYRAELDYNHPDAPRDVAEYAVEGLGGPIYLLWRMLRVVMRASRLVAVHNERVAAELREEYPGVPIATLRMGVALAPASPGSRGGRERLRREIGVTDDAIVFAAFGKVTPEKRIAAIGRAVASLAADGLDAHLLVIGDQSERAGVGGDRTHAAGYVADAAIGDYLSAADACLCLRWPTAQETSASWLQCLAAGRPTVISDLAHLADVPVLDPRTWRASPADSDPVAIAIDLLDEERGLLLAMRRLAQDAQLRGDLARAGLAYWSAGHTLELMSADYTRVIADAAARPSPAVGDLPAHVTCDYAELARAIAHEFGVDVDILKPEAFEEA